MGLLWSLYLQDTLLSVHFVYWDMMNTTGLLIPPVTYKVHLVDETHHIYHTTLDLLSNFKSFPFQELFDLFLIFVRWVLWTILPPQRPYTLLQCEPTPHIWHKDMFLDDRCCRLCIVSMVPDNLFEELVPLQEFH